MKNLDHTQCHLSFVSVLFSGEIIESLRQTRLSVSVAQTAVRSSDMAGDRRVSHLLTLRLDCSSDNSVGLPRHGSCCCAAVHRLCRAVETSYPDGAKECKGIRASAGPHQ
jgi:hypothetical protein